MNNIYLVNQILIMKYLCMIQEIESTNIIWNDNSLVWFFIWNNMVKSKIFKVIKRKIIMAVY